MSRKKYDDIIRSSGNLTLSNAFTEKSNTFMFSPSAPVLQDKKRDDKKGFQDSTNLKEFQLGPPPQETPPSTPSSTPTQSPSHTPRDLSPAFYKPKNQGDQLVGDSQMSLPEIQHLMDTPINWDHVDRPPKTDLLTYIHKVFCNYVNPDLFVRIKNDLFNCHLLVLQSYSSLFNKFTYGQTVELPSTKVSASAFHTIYDWMLQLDQQVTTQLLNRRNILDVFRAAQHLNISELEEQCWAFMDCPEIFFEETALLLYMESKEKKNEAVMELMAPRIARSFLSLVGTDGYDRLPSDVICMLLSSSFIQVHSEVEVFMAGVKWLVADWERRVNDVVEVMRCVRFGFIAPWQLVDIRRNPVNPEFVEVTEMAEVQQLLEEGLAYAVHRCRYGYSTEDYNFWVERLALNVPEQRNWIGEEKTYLSFQEFLKDVEEYNRTGVPIPSDKPPEKSCADKAIPPALRNPSRSRSPSPDKETQASTILHTSRQPCSARQQSSQSAGSLRLQMGVSCPNQTGRPCTAIPVVPHPLKKFTVPSESPPDELSKMKY